jgi:hypothetical protein
MKQKIKHLIKTALKGTTKKQPKVLDVKKLRNCHVIGSSDWLISTEAKYGGIHTNVKRNKVSQFDRRTPDEVATGGMTGGDRMFHHGYAKYYSQYLSKFLGNSSISNPVVCEVGILKGTGLAIWSELFPKSRIIGLDIDLTNTAQNIDNLTNLGAFKKFKPELHEFDQLNPNLVDMKKLFNNLHIDIYIDDGLHSEKSIITSFEALRPYMSPNVVCFIEDHDNIAKQLKETFSEFSVKSYGELTVLEKIL